MNKVITINLSGVAFQLEEGGYDLLRTYLENATSRLAANPDREEILSDIETAIADKFRGLLSSHKTVVITGEVSTVLEQMGPVEAEPDAAGAAASGAGTGAPKTAKTGAAPGPQPAASGPAPRRLYRIREGEMLAGVCNGIAAYFSLDPTLVRLAFVCLTIFWGTGVMIYIVMAFVVPEADTPELKAAAYGNPMTAQEFIRRAKEGYYDATRNFPGGQARREWSRQFRRNMRAQATSWGQRWRHDWSGWGCNPGNPGNPPYYEPRVSFAQPVFSLLSGGMVILWISAMISLLATGAVLGAPLPASVPVWVAALVLFIAYAIVSGSLKVARHMCAWGPGPAREAWPLIYLLEAIVWCSVAVVLLWLAFHYFPEVKNAVQTIPAQAHQAAHDIRAWWKGN